MCTRKEAPEIIVCSAIHYQDGKPYVHQPVNIASGFVVSGLRHNHCHATVQALGATLGIEGIVREHIERIDKDVQGFVTSKHRFVDRKEAALIAYNARQISVLPKELYSEDLF